MIILDICQKQPFDIIAMTPRGTLGLCCAHISQLMTRPAIYTLSFTLQLCYKTLDILQRVTKRQKVYFSSHDKLQKLHNINFAWHRFRGFLRNRVEKQKFPPSPVLFFFKQSKTLSLEFESRHTILNEEQGWSWASHIETHGEQSCCNKNFQILVISGFHWLADDANENHNYIEYLFIL